MRRSIAWLRRDLRLSDNRVLAAATEAERTWAVFVVDPALLDRHAGAPGRVAWFAANARALDEALTAHGSHLCVLVGPPEREVPRFASAVGADAVFAALDEDPAAVERDRRVADTVDLRLVNDTRLVPHDALRTSEGKPYSTFGPFCRALEARLIHDGDAHTGLAAADLARLAPRPEGVSGLEAFVRPLPPHELPAAGEFAAINRMRAFARRHMASYADRRNALDLDATSHLSPYMRVGAIGVRALWRAAMSMESRATERGDRRLARGAAAWRRELAWREFFANVLAAHPAVVRAAFRPEMDALAWADDAAAVDGLTAWRAGRTGYPLVDAGMRQLTSTGWMHNRARLTTASFLVKHLGVDWRRGESVFMEHLLDGDLAQNNGNWQWVAGVGTDAAPYFRILNPTLQAARFDPAGGYIRRWIPELADVSDAHIHEPWTAPQLPRDYPAPIVDHMDARERALNRYAAVMGRPR